MSHGELHWAFLVQWPPCFRLNQLTGVLQRQLQCIINNPQQYISKQVIRLEGALGNYHPPTPPMSTSIIHRDCGDLAIVWSWGMITILMILCIIPRDVSIEELAPWVLLRELPSLGVSWCFLVNFLTQQWSWPHMHCDLLGLVQILVPLRNTVCSKHVGSEENYTQYVLITMWPCFLMCIFTCVVKSIL